MAKAEKKRKNPIQNFYNHFKSIQTSILFTCSILTLFAILAVVIVSFRYTEDAVYENAINYTERLLTQLNTDVDSYIEYMENISDMVSESADIQSYFFDSTLSDEERAEVKKRLQIQFGTILQSRTDIYNIGVIYDQDNALINGDNTELNPNIDVTEQDWYQNAISDPDSFFISSSHVQNAVKDCYKWVITLSSVITSQKDPQQMAVVFIDLNYSSISRLCEDNSTGTEGYVFIIDQDGGIIYHPQQQLLYGGLKTEHTEEMLADGETHFILSENGENRLYIWSASEKTGWRVVSVTHTSELFRNSSQTKLVYCMMAILLLVAAVSISSVISRQITKPVQALRDSMEQVQQGHLEGNQVVAEGNNEITSLTNSFNLMSRRIETLVQQNRNEQEEKRRMELRALQSQINPHFLYNTLDSIIWMAESKKNEEVVLMTSAFAKLMRQNIGNDDEQISIGQEMMAIENYLTIQQMRYKDKLEYRLDVAADIRNEQIIKLVLQPLVENAIYHGLKYKETKGLLTVKGYRIVDDIFIEIEDDGAGMDETTLAHIFETHKVNYRSNGVGVYNVQKRLQLYYGTEYGLTYRSEVGKGTCVTVKIPISSATKPRDTFESREKTEGDRP
ncbi:MAG: sensor histidine kinase [Lachnospiraceae bacterium]|nr:sensor histidine kinase [Lachnospiraceae bacterium]